MEEKKRNKILGIVLTMSMLLVVIGTTMAAFLYTGRGTKENTIEAIERIKKMK